MRSDLGTLAQMIGHSMRDPADFAEKLVKLRMPHSVGWMGLWLATLLTVIVIGLERLIPGRPVMPVVIGGDPFSDVLFLGSLTVVFVFVIYYAGGMFGGTGTFGGTLLIMAWYQTIILSIVLVQFAAFIILPPLAGLIGLIGFGLQIWCLMHFLNELHGFKSLGKTFGVFIFSVFGLSIGLGFILIIIGGVAVVGGPQ